MMYEMFRHAADEGQKEAEQTVCQGHWEGLPKLDPEVDLSAIQLVGPETTKEETSPFTEKSTNSRGCQDPHLGDLS